VPVGIVSISKWSGLIIRSILVYTCSFLMGMPFYSIYW
jgi:hypothetical protein